MNSYINYPKNYNYFGNSLPTNMNNQGNNYNQSKLYEPYEGFIRGNLFRDLYDPYRIERPYQIKPMNEQAEILTDIDSLGFAMTDLNLYLDIYPDDQNAINLYNQYRSQKDEIIKIYESKYGPIALNSEALNAIPWAWDNKPWPWEN